MAVTDTLDRVSIVSRIWSPNNKVGSQVEQWAPILRFPLLFWIWGWPAYDYKLFMDISIRGVVVTVLFFLTCIMVTIGYKTRRSALVLALTMLFHGLLFYHRRSIVGAALMGGAAMLPIGAYYSLDRYLKSAAGLKWYQPKLSIEERPTPPALIAVVAALALFTVGGPFYKQVLNHNTRWVRSWVMFSEIGKDLVTVDFSILDADGTPRRLDYLSALGHRERILGVSRNPKALGDIRIIGTAQLDSLITRVCRAVNDPSRLRLKAEIAAVQQGWKTLYTGSEPICESRYRQPADLPVAQGAEDAGEMGE